MSDEATDPRDAQNAPKAILSRRLTPTGIVLNSFFALVVIMGWSLGFFAQDRPMGAWLASPAHAVLAFLGVWLLFTIATVVAAKLGHPTSRKD